MTDQTPKVTIYKAPIDLQLKAGTGEVDAVKIEKAEQALEANAEDFQPIALGFLDRLAEGVKNARGQELSMTEKIAGMTRPVMELKANARMFKYDLVTDLANIMLGFLETIKVLDHDAIEIVSAHQTTLQAIVIKKMKGDGGGTGEMLKAELEDACQRYFKRRKSG